MKLEQFYAWLAFRLPRRLAYWAAVRVNSYATIGKWAKECPSDVSVIDALKRWHECAETKEEHGCGLNQTS
jgi:hypothetical protein